MDAQPDSPGDGEQQRYITVFDLLMWLFAIATYIAVAMLGYKYGGGWGILAALLVGIPVAMIGGLLLTVIAMFSLFLIAIILRPREFINMVREVPAGTSETPVQTPVHDRAYWAKRLGRIRLGVEPVEEQLEQFRKITWLIIGVVTFLQFFFFALFLAFSRPDIGLALICIFLVPIELLAWFEYAKVKKRVGEYLKETREGAATPVVSAAPSASEGSST